MIIALFPHHDLVIIVIAQWVAGLANIKDALRAIPTADFEDLAIAGGHLHHAQRQLGNMTGKVNGCRIAADREWPAIKGVLEQARAAQWMDVTHLMGTPPIPAAHAVAHRLANLFDGAGQRFLEQFFACTLAAAFGIDIPIGMFKIVEQL